MFTRSEPEYVVSGVGRADIVIFDDKNHAWLVIEAKRDTGAGHSRDFDPYSPKVVKQAAQYANALGAPYFATYNGEKLILFQTYETFKPLLQRNSKYYRIKNIEVFAEELLKEIVNFKQGSARWDELDNAFVARLQEFHYRLSEQYLSSHLTMLKDKRFRTKYEYWVKEQGWLLPKEDKKRLVTHKKFAEQAAYLLLNQILFYKILETIPAYKLKKLAADSIKAFSDLPRFFEEASKKIDFQAVFEQDKIFSEIKLEGVQQELQEFVSELEDYDLTQFDSDVIGRIYQGVIPLEQRRALGSYYTPPEIVKLIVELTLTDPNYRVLDPACGSGGFVVGSYHKLKHLREKAGLAYSHDKIISNLFAIDINRFPAHLTAINLALQDLTTRTESVNVEIADFFDIIPSQGRFAYKTADITGEKKHEQVSIPNKVDVVVANPPYIPNQSASGGIPHLDEIRGHLQKVDAENIPALADIYAYFFTHASEFINDGGKIGFLTSDRWLMVDYGVALRDFILNNFRISAIIAFDAMAFEDALISTCVTILEKDSNKTKRNKNIVKIIRVKQTMKHEDVVKIVHSKQENNLLYENEQYRLVTKAQAELASEDKWHKFFFAPKIYFEALNTGKMVSVDTVADVSIGVMTGSNEFFYRTKEELEELGINKKYFLPLMKSVGQAEYVSFGQNDTEWLVFNIHPWVQKAIQELEKEGLLEEDTPISKLVKKRFAKWGLSDVVNFIESGERDEHNRKTICASRSIWFDLGNLDIPPLMYPKEYWKKPFVFVNVDGITIDQHLYSIHPKDELDPLLLGAILYSDLGTIFREVEGRIAGGEALNRNEITVNEVKRMRILDPRHVNSSQARKIIDTFKTLNQNERRLSENELKHMKCKLNEAILEAMDLKDRIDEITEAVEDLLNRRIQGGGQRKKVMIQRGKKEIKLRLVGAEIVKTRGMDDYM